MSSSKREYYHDKGEQDRSEGKGYNQPHGVIDDLTTWDSDKVRTNAEENIAYKEGWTNTDKQIKGK